MKKFFFVIVALVAGAISMNAANYTVDDASIDALFENAEMVEASAAAETAAVLTSNSNTTIIAWVIDTVGLGFFGIHRMILGSTNLMWLIYTITAGGIFGIVPFVDWVVLLIDVVNGTDSYIGNPKFLMWA